MEIANFQYKEKYYMIVLEHNKIKYGYQDNGLFNTNLTKEEINMMDYIMTKIVVQNNTNKHHKYGKTIHNKKLFQIMYDEISEKKFFFEIIDNKYKSPQLEDSIYLYKKFNSYKFYIVEKQSNEGKKRQTKNKKTVKQCVKVYGTFIIIYVSIGFALLSYMKPIFKYIGYSKMNTFYSNEQLDLGDVENQLLKNDKLSQEEKEEFRKFYTMIEENKKYINSHQIKQSLKNYSIEYQEETKKYIRGQNDKLKDHIIIYGKSSYLDCIKDPLYKNTLLHECCHTFHDITISGGLCEAINDTYTYEYTEPFSLNGYAESMCLYSLCEIINPDCFKAYYFQGNKQPLIDELKALINSEELAYNLIGNIDYLTTNELEKENCKNDQEIKKIDELQYELKTELYDSISKYFSAKYSYPIEEDPIMMAYLCNSGFLPEKNIHNKNQDYRSGYETTNIFPKGYFSQEYKEKHPYIELEQTRKDHKNAKHTIKIENIDRKDYSIKYGQQEKQDSPKKR